MCLHTGKSSEEIQSQFHIFPILPVNSQQGQPPSFILLLDRSSMFPHMRWKRQHSFLSQEGPTFLCITSLNVHKYLRDCDEWFLLNHHFLGCEDRLSIVLQCFSQKKCNIWNLKEPNDRHEGRSFSQGVDTSALNHSQGTMKLNRRSQKLI